MLATIHQTALHGLFTIHFYEFAPNMLMNFIEEEGGPLIWPSITESAQNAFDATCRKLYGLLNQQKHRS